MRIILALFLTVAVTKAWSWGDLGHQTVGHIAEQNLKPYAKIWVESILGLEPLAVAATWPDAVRSEDLFQPYQWLHFVEVSADLPLETKRSQPNGYSVFQSRNLLKGNQLLSEQKKILLRYLIHVVGDLHQPLHIGNGRDRGANLCQVYWQDPESGLKRRANLHVVWDELLFDVIKKEYQETKLKGPVLEKRWFGYKEMGKRVVSRVVFSPDEKAEVAAAPFSKWVEEAQMAHSTHVYPEEYDVKEKRTRALKPEDRLYCDLTDVKTGQPLRRAIEGPRIPFLTEGYIQRAIPLIESQLYKGGLRLAYLINELAAQEPASVVEKRWMMDDLYRKISR